jgi:hypothetical protein
MDIKEATHSDSFFSRSRVLRSYKHILSNNMDGKDVKDFLQEQHEPTTLFCDNNSTIMLSKNHVFHNKTKHIDTRYHFIGELVNKEEMSLEFCR